MENVAVIVMYATPGTGVVAFGCAFSPEGRPLHMALSPELAPDRLDRASAFFEWLQERETPEAVFVPHADGKGATVSAPTADPFGFEVMSDGGMLAPITAEASAEMWLHYAFATARQATLDAQSAVAAREFTAFEGLG